MVRDKYTVPLAQEQWEELRRLIWVGKHPAGVTARPRILIKSNDGWRAPQLAEALDVALGTECIGSSSAFSKQGWRGSVPSQPAPEVGRQGWGPPDQPGVRSATGLA